LYPTFCNDRCALCEEGNTTKTSLKAGVQIPAETNWTLESWNSSLEQLDYDSDIIFIGDSLTREKTSKNASRKRKSSTLAFPVIRCPVFQSGHS
jgi:hypothetical protein